MEIGKRYQITKRVKIHTKPTVQADITVDGTYKHETDKYYCFVGFRVKKSNVVEIIPIDRKTKRWYKFIPLGWREKEC